MIRRRRVTYKNPDGTNTFLRPKGIKKPKLIQMKKIDIPIQIIKSPTWLPLTAKKGYSAFQTHWGRLIIKDSDFDNKNNANYKP